jgi:hypothetical protein
MKIYVYLISDVDSAPQYVGISRDPTCRFYSHKKRGAWAHSVCIIEVVSASDRWQDRERFWIAYYKQWFELKNKNNGGTGCTMQSSETRAKIAASQRGKPLSPEHKAKLLQNKECQKGYKKPASQIEKMRISKTGVRPSEEARRRMSMAARGKKKPPRSPEHSLAISIAHTGRRLTEETKNKMRLAALGKPKSESHRASMVLAWRKRKGLCV